jgi:hypothetical protein
MATINPREVLTTSTSPCTKRYIAENEEAAEIGA